MIKCVFYCIGRNINNNSIENSNLIFSSNCVIHSIYAELSADIVCLYCLYKSQIALFIYRQNKPK